MRPPKSTHCKSTSQCNSGLLTKRGAWPSPPSSCVLPGSHHTMMQLATDTGPSTLGLPVCRLEEIHLCSLDMPQSQLLCYRSTEWTRTPALQQEPSRCTGRIRGLLADQPVWVSRASSRKIFSINWVHDYFTHCDGKCQTYTKTEHIAIVIINPSAILFHIYSPSTLIHTFPHYCEENPRSITRCL